MQVAYHGSGSRLSRLVDSTGTQGSRRPREWHALELPDRLPQIREGEPIATIAADSEHGIRSCRGAIANEGRDAVLSPRRNATL